MSNRVSLRGRAAKFFVRWSGARLCCGACAFLVALLRRTARFSAILGSEGAVGQVNDGCARTASRRRSALDHSRSAGMSGPTRRGRRRTCNTRARAVRARGIWRLLVCAWLQWLASECDPCRIAVRHICNFGAWACRSVFLSVRNSLALNGRMVEINPGQVRVAEFRFLCVLCSLVAIDLVVLGVRAFAASL